MFIKNDHVNILLLCIKIITIIFTFTILRDIIVLKTIAESLEEIV